MKNKIGLIGLMIIALAITAWMNRYNYIADSHHGIYRINRLTHEVDTTYIGEEYWSKLKEANDRPVEPAPPAEPASVQDRKLYEDAIKDMKREQ